MPNPVDDPIFPEWLQLDIHSFLQQIDYKIVLLSWVERPRVGALARVQIGI